MNIYNLGYKICVCPVWKLVDKMINERCVFGLLEKEMECDARKTNYRDLNLFEKLLNLVHLCVIGSDSLKICAWSVMW